LLKDLSLDLGDLSWWDYPVVESSIGTTLLLLKLPDPPKGFWLLLVAYMGRTNCWIPDAAPPLCVGFPLLLTTLLLFYATAICL